ncbi:class I SAM-dependent methyltransferase [Novosphingobium piscinae]|uniref:Class I SAM-dependent methyltransferase n=1 Tax=Novosphingobium piscinae TaxID=1507448 RepID=A0A7X1FWG7_9SPHN|nr:class I SAM-dependent methyltransferase [Novosphingobium piscinae]MBC2668124.1 class I SAM-dependent methyltransferase [Novosphingobium piscinae]
MPQVQETGTAMMEQKLSRQSIVASARRLYAGSPSRYRLLQSLRPYICPFEDLLALVPPRGRMLDIGCGAGLFLALSAEHRADVTAIGFDAEGSAIAVAQAVADRASLSGRLSFQHSAVGDPWPAGPFDFVSMIDVLHHIPVHAQREAILAAYRQVVPGGRFLYKDMVERPVFRAWWNRLHDLVVAKQWINYRAISDVAQWIEAAGGRIVDRSARNMGPYGHEWLVIERPA